MALIIIAGKSGSGKDASKVSEINDSEDIMDLKYSYDSKGRL